ncbi:MAG: hypothetical protein AB1413_04510 [Thermodesulfobacteriota bacterium]
MPHFGLMDETRMSREAAALLRAKLHLRCGRRRVREGKDAAGLATLYDALLSAMRWHILSTPSLREALGSDLAERLENERVVVALMRQAGMLDGIFPWDHFQGLVDQALMGKGGEFDRQALLAGVEALMTRLGVMPFDESELAPENPATF